LYLERGPLLEGHNRRSSCRHSGGYLQCAIVLQYPQHAAALGSALAERAREWQPTVVLSPALGGVVIGHEVARGLEVRALFAERQDSRLTLRRGFGLSAADRVLVVEDVVTTGGSTQETVEVARAGGAHVVGAAAIVDRSTEPTRLDVPLVALVRFPLVTFDPGSCPLCAQGMPVVKPGSRA
jgi:orotate phosphoribosyltransferase